MLAKQITPIVNVSNMKESFEWFKKLGWKKAWDWGDPPDFGAVSSGECEIFLCLDGQGSRARGEAQVTSGAEGDQSPDTGSWLCILVDDADEVHKHCLEQGIEVVWPPTDTPWHLREMRVRHPDGHILRIGHGLEEEDDDSHHEHPDA